MKNFRLILATSTLACAIVATAATTDRRAIERDLELFGPATAGLQAAGFEPSGTVLVGNTPDAFATVLRNDYDRWGKVIRAAGTTAE